MLCSVTETSKKTFTGAFSFLCSSSILEHISIHPSAYQVMCLLDVKGEVHVAIRLSAATTTTRQKCAGK